MVSLGRTLGKLLGHEGETLINGIHAFMKENPQSSLAAAAVWGDKEKYATQRTKLAPWNHASSMKL